MFRVRSIEVYSLLKQLYFIFESFLVENNRYEFTSLHCSITENVKPILRVRKGFLISSSTNILTWKS